MVSAATMELLEFADELLLARSFRSFCLSICEHIIRLTSLLVSHVTFLVVGLHLVIRKTHA